MIIRQSDDEFEMFGRKLWRWRKNFIWFKMLEYRKKAPRELYDQTEGSSASARLQAKTQAYNHTWNSPLSDQWWLWAAHLRILSSKYENFLNVVDCVVGDPMMPWPVCWQPSLTATWHCILNIQDQTNNFQAFYSGNIWEQTLHSQ